MPRFVLLGLLLFVIAGGCCWAQNGEPFARQWNYISETSAVFYWQLGDITKAVQRTRILGAAALDLCRVAAGQADGYFESGIYLWDVAAGGLILEEAGGRVEVLKSLPRPHHMAYLGTNGRVHGALRDVVQSSLH